MRATLGLPLTWPATLLLSVLVAVVAVPSLGAEVVAGKDKEIFGNPEAADMVQQARSFDPAHSRTADRDKAIELYEKAIALQPGARINAELAHRIAQLYSHYADPRLGIRAEPAKSVQWWQRTIQETNPRQLLWACAHMGLGCNKFISKEPNAGVAAFRAILTLDPDKIELPDWKAWPDPSTEHGRRQREEELARLRKDAHKIRVKAVEKIHYVMMRADRKAAAVTLLRIAKQYEGTPVGQRAAELADDALKRTSTEF